MGNDPVFHKPSCCARQPPTLSGLGAAAQVRPNHLLVRLDRLTTVHALDDAFTMSFKAVLRKACGPELLGCRTRSSVQGVGTV